MKSCEIPFHICCQFWGRICLLQQQQEQERVGAAFVMQLHIRNSMENDGFKMKTQLCPFCIQSEFALCKHTIQQQQLWIVRFYLDVFYKGS